MLSDLTRKWSRQPLGSDRRGAECNHKLDICRNFSASGPTADAARSLPGCAPFAPRKTTEECDLQADIVDGSDGTRTRDLRRDRPRRGSRRLTTIGAQSLCPCGFPSLRRFDSAWLSEVDFDVCCPFAARAGPPRRASVWRAVPGGRCSSRTSPRSSRPRRRGSARSAPGSDRWIRFRPGGARRRSRRRA
jgi:hypothetical protein